MFDWTTNSTGNAAIAIPKNNDWKRKLGLWIGIGCVIFSGCIMISNIGTISQNNCGLPGRPHPPYPGEKADKYRRIRSSDMWEKTKDTIFRYIHENSNPLDAWCASKVDRRIKPNRLTYAEVDRNAEHALFVRYVIIDIDKKFCGLGPVASFTISVVSIGYSIFKFIKHWHLYFICRNDPSPPSWRELWASLQAAYYTATYSDEWVPKVNRLQN